MDSDYSIDKLRFAIRSYVGSCHIRGGDYLVCVSYFPISYALPKLRSSDDQLTEVQVNLFNNNGKMLVAEDIKDMGLGSLYSYYHSDDRFNAKYVPLKEVCNIVNKLRDIVCSRTTKDIVNMNDHPCKCCGTGLNKGESPCWRCGAEI